LGGVMVTGLLKSYVVAVNGHSVTGATTASLRAGNDSARGHSNPLRAQAGGASASRSESCRLWVLWR